MIVASWQKAMTKSEATNYLGRVTFVLNDDSYTKYMAAYFVRYFYHCTLLESIGKVA